MVSCTAQAALQSTAFAAKTRVSRVTRRAVVVRAEKENTQIEKADRVAKSGGPIYVNATDGSALSYLDGSRPGDFGFDPLVSLLPLHIISYHRSIHSASSGSNSSSLVDIDPGQLAGLLDPATGSGGFISPEWLTYSEVIHCRYAMLGAAGCIAPEILAAAGVIPMSQEEVTWFKNGAFPFLGTYERGYWADPYTLFFVEIIAMQFAELRRWQDFKKPGSMSEQYFLGLEHVFKGSGNPSYPGGQFFNLFNLGKTEAELFKLKTNEIRNGRLAMLAMLGYGAQGVLTGAGPFACLQAHLADPVHNNLLTNFARVYGN
ncbi:hypothetical protein N2152v2_008428 [Parachlorella kessleri]